MITTLKTIARAFYVELKGKEEMRIASWHLGKFKPNATEEQVIIDLGHSFLESKDLNFLTINDAQHLYNALGALLDDVAASYPLLAPPVTVGEGTPPPNFNSRLLDMLELEPTTYHGPLYGNESSDTRTAVMDAHSTPYCLQIHEFPPRLYESHERAPGRWVPKKEFDEPKALANLEERLRKPNGRDLYYVDATEEHIQALFEECGGKKIEAEKPKVHLDGNDTPFNEEVHKTGGRPIILVDKARTPFCDQIHHPELHRGGKRDRLWKLKPFQELGQVRNAEAWLRLQLPRLRKDFHIISSPKFVLLHLRKGDSGLSTDIPSHLVNELYKDEKPRVYLDGSDVPFSEVTHIGGLNAMGGPHNSFRWFPKAGLSEGYVSEMITKLKRQLKTMEDLDLVEVVRDLEESKAAIAAGTIGYQFKLDGTVEDVETQSIQQS